MSIELEHANVTVSDPLVTAKWLGEVFDWHIRWKGPSLDNGVSVHVGTENSYLALYCPKGGPTQDMPDSYVTRAGLNHVAVVVDDLDQIEAKVVKAGFTPRSHQDYEPGKRFYFEDLDGIEYEVVSYAA